MADDAMDAAEAPRPEPVIRPAARKAPDLKLWRIAARDPQEPPFHFSSVPSAMVIVAEDAEHARAMAVQGAGGPVWADDDLVTVDEMTLDTPMVLSRDFGP